MPRGPTTTLRVLALAVAAAVSLGLVSGAPPREPLAALTGPAAQAPLPETGGDPFPLRRIYLTGDRLAAALDETARGKLVRLPRDEFEARVRAAAAQTAVPPPRLTEARYRATLTEGGLVGQATWQVAAAAPGLLALEPLRPTVWGVRWTSGATADLGYCEPPGRAAGYYLLVDQGGVATAALQWSARGIEEPVAERFELAFPPAPLALLELDLPRDRVPLVGAGQLLTGPLPAPSPERRLWQVAFGGQSRIDLAIRRPGRPGEPGPALRVGRSARYELVPGFATCTVELDLEAVRGQPSELVLEADPGFQVTDVTGPGRLTWRPEPPGKSDQATHLRVTALEGGTVGRVTVTGFAPLPAAGTWALPRVRVREGLPGADNLELIVDPELKFLGCDPADYRLTTAGTSERGYRVHLTGGLLPPNDERTDRRAPSVRVRLAGAEYTVTEEVTWRVQPGRTTLSGRFRIRATRGPLTRIPVTLPPGYAVETVRLVPDDPATPSTPTGPGAGFVIEPSRPLASGQTVEVQVDLRGPPAPPAPDPVGAPPEEVTLPFPLLTVPGAVERDGSLIVSVTPSFRALAVPPPAAEPTRGEGSTSWTFPFRGRPPDGRLILFPRRPRVVVSGETTVATEPATLSASTVLTVRCESGEFGSLLVFTPTPAGATWDLQSAGATVEPLPETALLPWGGAWAPSGWGVITGLATGSPGMVWQVTYPRPVAGEVALTATVRQPVAANDTAPIVLPMPAILGASPATYRVSLTPAAATRFEPAGQVGPLRPLRLASRGRGSVTPLPGVGWNLARIQLVNYVDADGGLTCVLSGTVHAAEGTVLPVELPNGATVTAVQVAGKQVDQPGWNGRTLLVPLPPPGSTGTEFEIRYSQPVAAGEALGPVRPLATVQSPLPGLPVAAEIAIRWSVSPELRRWPELDIPGEAGSAEGTELRLVRADVVSGAGYALAAVFLGGIVGLGVGRPLHRRGMLVLAVLVAGFGVAALLGPDGWLALVRPPLAAGLLGLLGLVLFARRSTETGPPGTESRPPLASTVSHTLILLLTLSVPTAAQAPEPATVFVVPGLPGTSDRLAILAPPAVLDRLAALARSSAPDILITAADYEASATPEGLASVTATFEIVCRREGEHVLALPLTDVRLEGMDLDGQPAFPDGSQPGRFIVVVRGGGPHRLTARFAVLTSAGPEREARFGIPDVPATRVRFTGPAGSSSPDVVTRRGAQTVTRAGDRPRVEVDHGGGKVLAIRWRDATGAAATPALSVREVCVWDLGPVSVSATAAFLYRIEAGAVNRLRLELPQGLEPGRLLVRSADNREVGLRDWQVEPGPDGWQTLTVRLQGPAEGRLTLVVRLYSRRPGSARPLLRFPRSVDVRQSDSYYAIRLGGVTMADAARTGVIDYPPEALARDFSGVPELGLDQTPADRAYQRSGGGIPEVRPALSPAGEGMAATSEVTWTVGSRADVQGQIRLTRGLGPVLEFDLPVEVQLHEVRGPDLFAWGRNGSRVQAWLRKPAPNVVLRWSGSLAGYPPPDARPSEPVATNLPFARPIGAGPITFRLRPLPGWAVVSQAPQGMTLLPESAVGEENYLVEPTAPQPRFQIYPPRPPASGEILETVERTGGAGRYRAVIRLATDRARPHQFLLRLLGLPPGGEPEARGPDGVQIGAAELRGDRTEWTVVVPAGQPSPVVLTLMVRVPLPGRLPQPAVSFGQSPLPWSSRVLLLDEGMTRTEGPVGWPTMLSEVRARWPGEAARLTGTRAWVAEGTAGRWEVGLEPTGLPNPGALIGGVASADREAVTDPDPAAREPSAPPHTAGVTYVLLTGWLAGWGVMLILTLRGRRRYRPEWLVGVGILGLVAVGMESWLALVFAGVLVLGVVARLGWLTRRVGRFVMR